MKLRGETQIARFESRYKRFFADVRTESGELLTTHCPNTGSMKTLLDPGRRALIELSDNPKRKLPWTLTALEVAAGKWALINTLLANRIVESAVEEDRIPELAGYQTVRREVRYGERHRCDLYLEGGEHRRPCYVEIKNVTMASTVARRADFPDAVTERGRRHLEAMTELLDSGARVIQFFLIGRSDRDSGATDAKIDPAYAAALRTAHDAGVEVLAYTTRYSPQRAPKTITVGQRCPFAIPELSAPRAQRA